MANTSSPTDIVIRGIRISEDVNGNWNLNDIWALAKSPASKEPKHWKTQRSAKRLIDALQKKVTIAYFKANKPVIPVIYSKRGRGNEGTFAHPILAASYAGYLSERLEIEMREIWLRYRSGDAMLADEILENASPEDNEWAGIRALGRAKRNEFTASLQAHGVHGKGYAENTDTVYRSLFNGTARTLKAVRGLPANANLRDEMEADELVSVMFAEMLSKQRIEGQNANGNDECVDATRRSSMRVRETIEAERRDLKKIG